MFHVLPKKHCGEFLQVKAVDWTMSPESNDEQEIKDNFIPLFIIS